MTKIRYAGIDALRFFSFFAIIIFHVANAVFFEGAPIENWRGSFFEWQQVYARSIPFSGFTIVAIHAFLFGHLNKSEKKRWWLILIGSIVLIFSYGSPLEGDFFWEWDIYQYLLVMFVLLELLQKFRSPIWIGALAFVVLWIPFWKFSYPNMPEILQHPLVGVCDGEGRGGWPLLPWMALPICFFFWGKAQLLWPIKKWEYLLWSGLLLLSFPFWGSYFPVETGGGFYCFVFRQEPWVFWAHFLWIGFLLRIFVQRSHWFLFLSFFSKWKINQHFGWAYLCHLGGIFVLLQVGSPLRSRPVLFSLLPLFLLLATEIVLRLAARVFPKNTT